MDFSTLSEIGAAGLLDLAVLAVLLLSGVLALMRGFMHEVLSILGWVGAAISALYAYPFARPLARDLISVTLIADIVAFVALFIVAFAVFSVLGNFLARKIQGNGVDSLDRTLGFVFGLARGGLLVALAYGLITFIYPPELHPRWVKDSRTVPLIDEGAFLLKAALPDEILDVTLERIQRAQQRADETEQAYRRLNAPEPRAVDIPEFKGYSAGQRQGIEGLTEAIATPPDALPQ